MKKKTFYNQHWMSNRLNAGIAIGFGVIAGGMVGYFSYKLGHCIGQYDGAKTMEGIWKPYAEKILDEMRDICEGV